MQSSKNLKVRIVSTYSTKNLKNNEKKKNITILSKRRVKAPIKTPRGNIKVLQRHKFKNKKPVWRRKSQLWVKLFRSFISSLNGFNRQFKRPEKTLWFDLLKYRRTRWYFKNKIASRKAAFLYFGITNKKAFLRVQEKIRVNTRSLLRYLMLLDNRLDFFLVRFGWSRTIKIARRMIIFGAVMVNSAVVKKPYFIINYADSISLNKYLVHVFTYFKFLRRKSIIKYKIYTAWLKKKKIKN